MDVAKLVDYAATQESEMIAKLGSDLFRAISADYIRLENAMRTPKEDPGKVDRFCEAQTSLNRLTNKVIIERGVTWYELEDMSKRILDEYPRLMSE